MKNREYEALIEAAFHFGKVRVWLTADSLEAAQTMAKNRALQAHLMEAARAQWPDFVKVAATVEETLPNASAIAITDAAGNGITLYPDWK